MTGPRSASSRVFLGIVVVLVVAAVAGAAVLSAIRSTPDLDPGTPEGVAQAFFRAVLDEDDRAAMALLDPELRQRCEGGEIPYYLPEGSARVVLTSTEVLGERAVVVVEIDQVPDPSPFDLDGYSTRVRLVMDRKPGGWEISEMPWPFYCPEGR